MVPDEIRGGVPQRPLLQLRYQLTHGLTCRNGGVMGLRGGIGGVRGHGLLVADHRLTDPVQVHGIANQRILGRHHHLRATELTVTCRAVLGLLVDVGLLRRLGHPHMHAAHGLHHIRHRDVDAALALPVDHQDLALLTGLVENPLQLGFPVRTPADDPLGVDRFDRLARHPRAHQRLHLPLDQVVAVTQDLLEPSRTPIPYLVRVLGDRAQLGMGAFGHIVLAFHQPMRLGPSDLVRRFQTVDFLQHRVQVGERAGRTGHFVEEGSFPDTVDFDRIDAFGGVRIRAHHDLMVLGLLPSGLGRAELLRLDGLREARLTRLRAPPGFARGLRVPLQPVLGLIDDDDLARVHFVVDTCPDEKFGVGGGLEPGGAHTLQPVPAIRQRLDLCPPPGCQLGLTVVPVHELRCAVGLHADFLGDSPEAEIFVRQRPVRQRLGEKVVRVEHLPGCGLPSRLLGTFGPQELPFAAVDDAVHLVDQHMPRWLDAGIAQMPDGFAGRDHDRRPAFLDRPEAVRLIGAEHIDPEVGEHLLIRGVGQQLLIRDDFAIGQPIGRCHEQHRAMVHRTLYRGGHEYQRFALAGFHFHRTRFHRVHRFRLLDPQHHSARHRVTDRAAPDDLYCRQHRLVLITAV
ncbi:hypothetical protein GCM10011588_30950 [Nocardia jinanensis]|uniref:Uncharacterized protein n=1 Tax=Nocardia jinanensis TaxID=382504 RepID=A0A917RM83_9NOCA|nr:hypothetical protein GCM10011588_30950 [Nocardia jinanensis]